jgi:putative heme-binding domain-containing protein
MVMTNRRVFSGMLWLAIATAPSHLAAQSQADIDAGKQLFQGMCVGCHGADGAGGDAPSLNRARLLHAPTDEALIKIVTNGIPNTAMPRVRRFSDSETQQLVAYVRSLGKIAQAPVPGDAQKGAAIYKSLGCASCHIINGVGGNFGPDLTDIGFMRGASYLREAVIDPGGSLPKNTLKVPGRGYAEFLPLRIVTNDGSEVRGIRVNEDAFTIQVRDQAGKFYSLRKSGLELLDKQTGQSLMPSFRNQLTPSALIDLVAYLSSLRSVE